MKRVVRVSAVLIALTLTSACAGAASGSKSKSSKTTRKTTTRKANTTKPPASASTTIKTAGYSTASAKVLRTIPKDPAAFTQGLEVSDGILYESVGMYGQSEMRTVDLKSGQVTARVALDKSFFAEGATVLPDGNLVQLTWREKTAIVRDRKTLAEVKRLPYDQEGWGVCYSKSAKAVIQTDGTNQLLFRDPVTFALIKSVPVTHPRGTSTANLNELECEGSSVFANVWTTDRILEIDLATGTVVREVDASNIVAAIPNRGPDDVLNGIAALGNGRYLITGKRFPAYYEVTFGPTK
jgi:glutaminyl-peptide cyclotransferase